MTRTNSSSLKSFRVLYPQTWSFSIPPPILARVRVQGSRVGLPRTLWASSLDLYQLLRLQPQLISFVGDLDGRSRATSRHRLRRGKRKLLPVLRRVMSSAGCKWLQIWRGEGVPQTPIAAYRGERKRWPGRSRPMSTLEEDS